MRRDVPTFVSLRAGSQFRRAKGIVFTHIEIVRAARVLLAGAAAIIRLSTETRTVDQGSDISASPTCDRVCLDGFVDQYLSTLLAHDPSRAPLAKTVTFTENGQILNGEDTRWGTISGLGQYKFYFEDRQDGQVGPFGTIRENDVPAILAARLKVEN